MNALSKKNWEFFFLVSVMSACECVSVFGNFVFKIFVCIYFIVIFLLFFFYLFSYFFLFFICLFKFFKLFILFCSFFCVISISVNDWKWIDFHLSIIVVNIDMTDKYIILVCLVVQEVLTGGKKIGQIFSIFQYQLSVSSLFAMTFKYFFIIIKWFFFLIFSFSCFSICLSPRFWCMIYVCCVFIFHYDVFKCLFVLFLFNILIFVSLCYLCLFNYYLLCYLFLAFILFSFVFIFLFISSVELIIQETIDGYVGEFFILVVLVWWVVWKCSGIGLDIPSVHYILTISSFQCIKWIRYSLIKSEYEI